MARIQVGVRLQGSGVERVDALRDEYGTTRTEVVRILLSEALASQPIVDATRKRLAKAL